MQKLYAPQPNALDTLIDTTLQDLRQEQKRFISFELTPSVGAQIADQEKLAVIRDSNLFDGFVCTDSPLARFKPSSILSSIIFQNILLKPLICTLSMRDRNSIALCGEVLGANAFGLRAFLSLTGDPIKLGDSRESKGVFESNSTKLNGIITRLNSGLDLNAKPLKTIPKHIYNFNAINSYALNPQTLQNKIIKKIQSSLLDSQDSELSGLFTQPVYSIESAYDLLENLALTNRTLGTNTAMILGFFPVVSYKTAIFLRDKLPGVYIPQEWIARLEKAHNSKNPKIEEHKVGIDLSKTLFDQLTKAHNKFHVMANGNFALAREILL